MDLTREDPKTEPRDEFTFDLMVFLATQGDFDVVIGDDGEVV